MIRISHVADSHIGYRALNHKDDQGRNQRGQDAKRAFADVVASAIARDVDLFVHAGDVFDRPRPTWEDIAFVIAQIQLLLREGIDVAMIAGNHDTASLRTRGDVFDVIQQACPDLMLAHGDEQRYFYRDEYTLNLIASRRLKSEYPPTSEGTPEKINILVVHGIVGDIKIGRGQAEPGEEQVPDLILQPDYDYIALGDWHQHQQVRANAWYSGSTERFGWGDKDATPGYLLAAIERGIPAFVEHIAIEARPMRQLEPISVTNMDAPGILQIAVDEITNTLTPDAMARVLLTDVVDQTVVKAVQRLISRNNVGCWSLGLQVQLAKSDAPPDDVPIIGGEIPKIDLEDAFRMFVESRAFTPEFKERFTAIGGLALATATQRERERAMTED